MGDNGGMLASGSSPWEWGTFLKKGEWVQSRPVRWLWSKTTKPSYWPSVAVVMVSRWWCHHVWKGKGKKRKWNSMTNFWGPSLAYFCLFFRAWHDVCLIRVCVLWVKIETWCGSLAVKPSVSEPERDYETQREEALSIIPRTPGNTQHGLGHHINVYCIFLKYKNLSQKALLNEARNNLLVLVGSVTSSSSEIILIWTFV